MVCSFCLAEFVVPAFGWMPCSSGLLVWFWLALACDFMSCATNLLVCSCCDFMSCVVNLLVCLCLLSLFLFIRIVGILYLLCSFISVWSLLLAVDVFPLLCLRFCARLAAVWVLLVD